MPHFRNLCLDEHTCSLCKNCPLLGREADEFSCTRHKFFVPTLVKCRESVLDSDGMPKLLVWERPLMEVRFGKKFSVLFDRFSDSNSCSSSFDNCFSMSRLWPVLRFLPEGIPEDTLQQLGHNVNNN